MFEPEIEYTYWPPEPIPYEPYRGYTTAPSHTRQQTFAVPGAPRMTRDDIARTPSIRSTMPAYSEQKKPATPRMSKAEALEVVDQCKRWLVAGSIVAFSVLSGLVAGHVVGSSSQGADQSNNQSTPSFNSPSNNGGFFQQRGNNFGNGNSGQSPFSGSHTS